VTDQRGDEPADDTAINKAYDEAIRDDGAEVTDEHPEPVETAPVVDTTPSRSSRLAGVLVAVQAVVVLAAAVFYLVEALVSDASSLRNVAMAVVLFLLMGGGLLLVARDLVPRRRWARAPAITWEVICLPVALGLFQSGRWYVGLPVGLVAVVVLVAVMTSRPAD
jgi:hypothetical protein